MPEQPALSLLSGDDQRHELPVLGGEPRERCDAARNRRRILAAAETLIARDGPEQVSMDQIATAAGVGKGTLFRRFGDRANLLLSLLSDRESAFQERLIRGEPPLGPGAPPAERLLAFGPAYLEEMQGSAELRRAIDGPGGAARRMAGAPYQVYRTHLILLLRQAAPRVDAEYQADLLLAPLAGDVMLHQRDVLGMPVERLAEAWRDQARRLLR